MGQENARSRFLKVMRGELPEDRLPVIEWAPWWDQTVARWRGEGLPADLDVTGIKRYFGLDVDRRFGTPQVLPGLKPKYHDKERYWIRDADDYEALRPSLYPDPIPYDVSALREMGREQAAGEIILWTHFQGFFWWPRVLFGIERHLYAFYDHPELMHRINQDQADFIRRALDAFSEYCAPDFMTFAEDMSYNHGPMISREQFQEFLTPYYRQVVPRLRERGIIPFIDSDGNVEPLIPWFEAVGLEGILPLERMAGVDVNRIRACHPRWKMIGAFDKTVMHRGEARMREEFERLLPAMRGGCFVPGVDHQTPPEVSMADYRLYLRLLREYAARAVKGDNG